MTAWVRQNYVGNFFCSLDDDYCAFRRPINVKDTTHMAKRL
jgi:hypothetical protein